MKKHLTNAVVVITFTLLIGVIIRLHFRVVGGKNAIADYKSKTDKILKDLKFSENENIRLQKAFAQTNENVKDIQDALGKLEQEAKQNSIVKMEAGGSKLDHWLGARRKLGNYIKYHPNYAIPELKYLTAKEWLLATDGVTLENEADYRAALGSLRYYAVSTVGKIFGQAVKDFSNANNGIAPTQLSDIVQYLPADFDPDILERYATNPSGETSRGAAYNGEGKGQNWIIREAASQVDSIWNNGAWVSDTGEVFLRIVGADFESGAWAVDSVRSAIKNYVRDYGAEPTNADQIDKYIDARTNKAGKGKIDEIFQSLLKK